MGIEHMRLTLSEDGIVTLFTGQMPHGQSHQTTLAQIAADEFGVIARHHRGGGGVVDAGDPGDDALDTQVQQDAGQPQGLAAHAGRHRAEVAGREDHLPGGDRGLVELVREDRPRV